MPGSCEKWFDMLFKLFCLVAVIVQLGFNLQGFLQPKFPTTRVKDVALKDLDFPLIFKICVQPGFNQTALYEVGYSGLLEYFKGKSRFNGDVFGWAGHTSDNRTWGGVAETFEKVGINSVGKLMDGVWVKLNTEEYLRLPGDQVYLGRINYPHNCYTLNLTKNSSLGGKGVKLMHLRLKTEEVFQAVQIQLQGETIAPHRDIYDHTVFSTGDALTAKSGEHRKFAVRIDENIFVEEDDSKNCREYPNSDFASYSNCDDHYTRSICSKAALLPIWLPDQLDDVTAHAVFRKSGKSDDWKMSKR